MAIPIGFLAAGSGHPEWSEWLRGILAHCLGTAEMARWPQLWNNGVMLRALLASHRPLGLPDRRLSRKMIVRAGGLLLLAWLLARLPLPMAIALSLAAPAALVLLRAPWILWVPLAATLPFLAGWRWGPLSLADIALGVGLGLWFAQGARRGKLGIAAHPVLVPWALYLAVQLLSLSTAPDLGEAAREVVKWLEFGALLFLIGGILPAQGRIWVGIGLLAGGAAQAALGLYQFLFRVGPEWFVVMDRFMRASGTFGQPNPFAGYLGLTLPVAVALALTGLAALGRALRDRSWGKLRLWAVAAGLSATVAILGAGLLASWSRGGWLGAAAGAATVLALHSRRFAGTLIGVAVLASSGVALAPQIEAWLPPPVAERVTDLPVYFGLAQGGLETILAEPLTHENFSVQERIAHWVAALAMWDAHPWLGVGPGNYPVVYARYQVPGWDDPLGHAHNVYLNVLGETGIAGLFAYGLLWLTAMLGVLRRWWSARDPWQKSLNAGVLGVLVHLAVHNLVDNLYVQGIYLHIALWLTLVLRQDVPDSVDQGDHPR